jgi:hypothetical protein
VVKSGTGAAPAAVQQPIYVTVFGVPASAPSGALLVTLKGTDIGQTATIAGLAVLPIAIVLGLVLLVYLLQPAKKRNFIAALVYDEVTQTYSLSRAQFFWWLLIIAYAYTFLFVGRGATAGNWEFPPLNGLLGTLVISTVTLLGALATGAARGSKGSGAANPSTSDLIMHGGVIAPERIQQVLWTVLAGIAVLWIVVTTYTTTMALPDIPQELLALMGLSSIAYVTGKIVRSPGPIIRQVDVKPDTSPVQLVVSGENLDRNATSLTPADLKTTPVPEVVIVNSDGQRSEWPTPADLPDSSQTAMQPGLVPGEQGLATGAA